MERWSIDGLNFILCRRDTVYSIVVRSSEYILRGTVNASAVSLECTDVRAMCGKSQEHADQTMRPHETKSSTEPLCFSCRGDGSVMND